MIRIAHRLASGEWPKCLEKNAITINTVKGLMAGDTHVVVCDNVAEVCQHRRDNGLHNPFGDLTESFPPWKRCIYDWNECRHGHYGALTVNFDLNIKEDRDGLDPYMVKLTEKYPNVRWVCGFFALVVLDGRLMANPGMAALVIDASGTPLAIAFSKSSDERLRAVGHHAAHIACTTNSFLNCKNVSQVDSTDIDAPPAKWQRRMKTPEIRYSRIKIDGFTSEAKSQGGGIDGHNKAWHICRGNFATYTDAKPLFGKYTGRYWRPQHVRGDKKHGEVHSTHEIARPKT